ncbi:MULTISPECIES: hypothetical protein [Scytonema]|uniref:Uncharacterized protein n=2 Tax=Nostocales TaxID=1161 RepID=A0A0C1R4V5_9CYAN
MKFWKHIEIGLTNFGQNLNSIHQRHIEHHEESISLGLIGDEEKLRMLKRELYCEVRLSSPDPQKILNLTSAIETLEQLKQAEFDRKQAQLKHSYTFPVQLEVFTNTTIFLAIALVIVSYLGAFTCGNSRSQFCSNARVFPSQVEQFFKD